MLAYQAGERWRDGEWELDAAFYTEDFLGQEASKGGLPRLASMKIMSDVIKNMRASDYLVVQELPEGEVFDDSLPVTIEVMEGNSLKSFLDINGIGNSYMYGPAMASEIDSGFSGGIQYVMDISGFSGDVRKALLANMETVLQEAQDRYMDRMYSGYSKDRAYEEDEYGMETDSGSGHSGGGQETLSPAREAIRAVLTEAYDCGARPPYIELANAFEKAREELEKSKLFMKVPRARTEKTGKQVPVKEKTTSGKEKEPVMEKPVRVAAEAREVKPVPQAPERPVITQKPPVQAQPVIKKETGKETRLAPEGWDKAIFIKPGIAVAVKESDGKAAGFGISINDGEETVLVKYNGYGKDAASNDDKSYSAKQLFKSARYKYWVVVEPKKESAVFEVISKDGRHVRDIGIDGLRELAREKNREWDKARAAGNNKPVKGVSDGRQ